MFDGLSGTDWVFLVGALVLGFGVVKFLLVHRSGDPAPPVEPDHAEGEPRESGLPPRSPDP